MCVNLDYFISHATKVYGAMPRNNALLVCNLCLWALLLHSPYTFSVWLITCIKNRIRMAKYDMCEAMCALPNNVVTMRRRSLVMPIAVFFVGVACFVVNGFLEGGSEMSNIKSAIVLFGAIFVLVGGAICLMRLGDGGMALWHTGEKCFLKKEELKFRKEDKTQVVDLVKRGDFTTLRSVNAGNVSAIVVMLWSTPSEGFVAAQAFEYIDWEMEPISELSVKA